jgi:O-antigen ligase
LAYLCWLPLPFGSVTERAQPPLIAGALVICALAALAVRGEGRPSLFRFWSLAAILFLAVAALELVPLPDALLGLLSPEALRTWRDADHVAALAGVAAPARFHPLTVDPQTTSLHLFRVAAYFAIFLAAALLFRRRRHRVALAMALGATALFETLYGIRELVLGRHAIWGWVNGLIFNNRVFGTFVNPNHFAHYAAIVMPLGVYLSAQAWHDAAPDGAPLGRHIVRLMEKRFFRFACGAAIAIACLAAIVLAQSRGALVAAGGGFAVVGAMASGPRHALRRALLIAVALGAIGLVVVFLSGWKVAARLQEPELATFGGRAVPVKAALELWKRFPLFGTGLGTFGEMSSMTYAGSPEVISNHAHDDYVEVLATTGIVGLLAALIPFFTGYAALIRATFGVQAAELTWARRAFQAAALTSLTAALIHALIDFNFFIPANPATLAAIAGTAAALREQR